MLNKWISAVFLTAWLSAPLQAQEDIPSRFYVTQRFFSWTTTFDIETDQECLGTVHRKIFSWMPEYHLINPQNEFLAKAKMRFWSLGASFDITDHQNNSLGSVNQTFSWLFPTFKVLSPSSEVLAQAVRNFWGTKWTITDPENEQLLAVFSCPYFWFKQNWTLDICNRASFSKKNIHPHLFFTLLAFQVDKKKWEACTSYLLINQMQQRQAKYLASKPLLSLALSDAEPEETDFLFIEALVEEMENELADLGEEERFDSILTRLMGCLASDELTNEQKAALTVMLQERLFDQTPDSPSDIEEECNKELEEIIL